MDEIKKGTQDDEQRIGLAAISAIQGKKEEALKWLQKAIDVKWLDYGMVEKSPWFENIKPDPRFRQMMNRVKNEIAKMSEEAKNL